jgi:hypothetical protein
MHLVGYLYEDYHDARSLEHKENVISSKAPRTSLKPANPPIQSVLNGYWSTFVRVKRPKRELYHRPPYSTKVKNERRYISYPIKCIRDADRDKF